MSNSIAKITAVGGSPLARPLKKYGSGLIPVYELEKSGLMRLLELKNGFYAFEGALHVRPLATPQDEGSLEVWNASAGWRSDYDGLADGCLFFAEDVFGSQFCVYEGGVATFDPETGEKAPLADDAEGWARKILDDYDVLTGYALAHEWQAKHGAIPRGQRLVPKIPFVLGGEFTIDNLFLLDDARAMRSRANLAVQIRDLPEGAAVEFKVTD